MRPGAAATGACAGTPTLKTPLRFVRFEPFVVPKRSLTGDSTERVDTRVLQVIYRVERDDLPLFVGQQIDVFIDAQADAGGAMRRRALSLSFLLPSAVACAVGPRYQPPEHPRPGAWQESPAVESTARRPRSITGGPPSTTRSSTASSPSRRGQPGPQDRGGPDPRSRAARGIAASAGLAQVDVGGSLLALQRSDAFLLSSRLRESSPFGPREQNVFEVGFDAGWEIDVFGGVRRDKEAALAQVQAAEEARSDVLVTLLADVARNYVELRASQRQLQILDETLRSERDTLEMAKARFEGGLGTELDVARAEGLLAANTHGARPWNAWPGKPSTASASSSEETGSARVRAGGTGRHPDAPPKSR